MSVNNQRIDCFGFRSEVDNKGIGIVYGPDNERYIQKQGRWKGIDIYRLKCLLLVITSIPKGVVSFAHRTWDFAHLGSFRRAKIYSEISCKKLDFKAKRVKTIHYIGLRKVGIYTYNFSACLTKDVAKLVTFPIYLVAIECFAILGCFLPKPGRFLIAKTQRVWEFDNLLERRGFVMGSRLTPKFTHKLNSSFIHYIAPCFQSLEDCNRLNLYLYLENSHPRELRNLALSLQNDLNTYQKLLPIESFLAFSKSVKEFKDLVKKCSPLSLHETVRINGKVIIEGWCENSKQLEEYRIMIETVQNEFNKYVNCEIDLNDLNEAFNSLKLADAKVTSKSRSSVDKFFSFLI